MVLKHSLKTKSMLDTHVIIQVWIITNVYTDMFDHTCVLNTSRFYILWPIFMMWKKYQWKKKENWKPTVGHYSYLCTKVEASQLGTRIYTQKDLQDGFIDWSIVWLKTCFLLKSRLQSLKFQKKTPNSLNILFKFCFQMYHSLVILHTFWLHL